MSNNGDALYNNLFSSLISDIKSYNGNDPLLPWLRGIRKMKETLSPELLREKLPRFLQKCAETFLNDRRYRNDLRYLRVWLQLMDFVDDPKAVLKTMEVHQIGMKKSLFYQAYALYYEKMRKFDAAEKIYHLGVQNLAEPADELQKSYDQFLQRKERHKNRRAQLQDKISNRRALDHGDERHKGDTHAYKNIVQTKSKEYKLETHAKVASLENKMVPLHISENEMPKGGSSQSQKDADSGYGGLHNDQLMDGYRMKEKEVQEESMECCGEETVVVKFVDTAFVGKSDAEDARHHGLLEPTINTREAINAINSMFQQPLEPSIAGRARRNQSKTDNNVKNGFKVFSDEGLETGLIRSSFQMPLKDQSVSILKKANTNQPLDEPFEIYVDSQDTNGVHEKDLQEPKYSDISTSSGHASVFAKPNDPPEESCKDTHTRRVHQAGLREDTVVYRFVGSTITDEPEVENVWHHGLIDPTVNLKEAMNDINSMFGKPIEFVRKGRSKKHDNAPEVKNNCGGFLILPDDDEPGNQKRGDDISRPLNFARSSSLRKQDKAPDAMNNSGFQILLDDESDNRQQGSLPSSSTSNGSDLFEQTICTKEAISEINKLFSMPMNF